jgi:hypothetical protein
VHHGSSQSRVPSRRSCLGRAEVHERGIEGEVNIAHCEANRPKARLARLSGK